MGMWIVPPVAGLIEPAPAPEFYIDGIGAVEGVSGGVRLYLFSQQMPLEAKGAAPDRIVIAKVIRPRQNLALAIGQLAQCIMTERSPEIEARIWPRLVT